MDAAATMAPGWGWSGWMRKWRLPVAGVDDGAGVGLVEVEHADDEVGLDRVLEFDHADAGELVGEAFGLLRQECVPGGKRRGGGAKQRELL